MSSVVSFETMVEYSRLLQEGGEIVVLTTGGMDPLHVGHVRLIRQSAERPDDILLSRRKVHLFVLVNDDEFLMRKKGYVFMPLEERMEMVAAIRGVSYVAPWSSPTQFVDEAIRQIRPHFLTKGGDRSSPAQMAQCEIDACNEVHCRILYGVGGSQKIQSSSWLVEKLNASKKT